MTLWAADLHRLSYEEIKRFCENGWPESVILDYKRVWLEREKVVKAVSALANTQGGILIFGVGTKPNSKLPDWPSDGMDADTDFETRVTRMCIDHIRPPVVPRAGYVPNPSNAGKAFGVVGVEPSLFTPHVVAGGTRIYVRRADNSDPLPATLEEIVLMLNRREKALALEESELEDLRWRVAHGWYSGQRSIFLFVVPVFGRADAISPAELNPHSPYVTAICRDLRGAFTEKLTSYSQGVQSRSGPHRLALTYRGAVGFSYHHAESEDPSGSPLPLSVLLRWSVLAGRFAAEALLASKHWGHCRVIFEANGYDNVAITDEENREFDHGEIRCTDDRIRVEQQWPAVEVKADPRRSAAKLLPRIMLAFGLTGSAWTEEVAHERLERWFRSA